tara:strand:+ start:224 stop:631 length:408 start_codon:yes stop_codon:yes gene_type:complete
MKKFILLLVLTSFVSCGSASSIQGSATYNSWYAVEMKPSQITYNGNTIYSKKLNDTYYVIVYYDESLEDDARYYHNKLWESYGWTIGSDKMTASGYANKPKVSSLHISVKRGVAIYSNPAGEFSIFRVVKKRNIE